MLRALILTTLLLALSACGTPMVHTAAPLGQTIRDDGIAGEWATGDPRAPTQIRAIIAGPPAPTTDVYPVNLTVHHEGEFKTSLNLELRLTSIEGHTFADLYLARTERDRIVGTYGFLAVPVHQVLRISRDGDAMRAWPFVGEWIQRSDRATRASQERITVGADGRVYLVTAPSDELRAMIAQRAQDLKAFGDPLTFTRIR